MLSDNDLLQVEREYCSRSLANFAERAWPILEPSAKMVWGWSLDAICEHLEAVSLGEIKRLLVNVPPGSMKSLLAGVIWPAWEWGPLNKPEMRYLSTAHKVDLATRDSLKCRRLVTSEWYQSLWPIELLGDQNAKTKFENSRTGFRESMAFGSMTGSRGDRVILDDPHSVDDANSKAALEGGVKTFREALPTRVNNDDSAIVIIMQRLHEEDVSAAALELGYDHLCIPMRFERERKPTVIGWKDPRSKDGELMLPERFSEQYVQELELSLGVYATAGQLQQRPAPRSGGIIKPAEIEIVDALPSGLSFVRGWDLAATKDAGDATTGVKQGVKDGIIYIADVVHFRGSPEIVEKTIVQTASLDGRNTKHSLPQDPAQAGKSQASYLSKALAGYSFEFSPESGDKLTRAMPFIAQVNAGNVKMLRGDWNKALIDEFKLIPFGKHDDILDGCSRAYNAITMGSNKAGVLLRKRK